MRSPDLIAVQIAMICEYPLAQRSIVVLSSPQGDTYLPIRMYRDEAVAVEHVLKGHQAPRTSTDPDTMLQLIASLGGRVEQIVIQNVVEQSYYATLTLVQGVKRHEVDLRLSHALVLAVRSQAPLYVTPTVFDDAGITLDMVETDAAVGVAELPPSEQVTTSDQWPRPFIEQVWSFLFGVLHGVRTPLDLAKLRGLAWNERIPAHEITWEGQRMQAVQLPAREAAWLLIRPELWEEIQHTVEWMQRRDLQQKFKSPALVELPAALQRQVDDYLANALTDLADVEAQVIALMHLSGRLVAWQGLDSYEDAVRMGRAAVKDYLLGRSFTALVGNSYESGINMTYERDTALNPAMAAGAHTEWTNEALINEQWMLVIGFATDQSHEQARRQFATIQHQLQMLLPYPAPQAS